MPHFFHISRRPGLVKSTCLVVLSMSLVCVARAKALGGACAQAEATSASGSAPAPRHSSITPSDNLTKIDEVLHLSDAQKAAILPVLQKLQDELFTLQQSMGGRGSDSAQIFVNTAMSQVRAQLTAVQGQAFDTMRATRRSAMFQF